MLDTERAAIERAIEQVLLEQWDPLALHGAAGEHPEYRRYVPAIYSLLARGCSEMQLARHLHQLERDDLGHPELATRDLTPVLHALREIERRM